MVIEQCKCLLPNEDSERQAALDKIAMQYQSYAIGQVELNLGLRSVVGLRRLQVAVARASALRDATNGATPISDQPSPQRTTGGSYDPNTPSARAQDVKAGTAGARSRGAATHTTWRSAEEIKCSEDTIDRGILQVVEEALLGTWTSPWRFQKCSAAQDPAQESSLLLSRNSAGTCTSMVRCELSNSEDKVSTLTKECEPAMSMSPLCTPQLLPLKGCMKEEGNSHEPLEEKLMPGMLLPKSPKRKRNTSSHVDSYKCQRQIVHACCVLEARTWSISDCATAASSIASL